MNHKISEVNKLDTGITTAAINGALTGQYFQMSCHRKALFIAILGVMAEGVTSTLQVMQATDSAGTDAKVITDAAATITANVDTSITRLAIVTAAGGVHVAGQTVTINGLVFTAAAADVPETREYAVGSSGADSAANLLAKINNADETIGIPDILGTASIDGSDSIITLTADEPGEKLINAEASDSTTVVSTIESIGFVEIDATALDKNNGFSHVAMRITNSAETVSSVSLVRDNSRYTPEQFVAASA